MKTEWTEDDLKELASQLRKPQGELGAEVAAAMNDGNLAMNLHTLAVVNPGPDEHILEIGMANGYFVRNILGIDPTIGYTGCDYSEDMVKQAIEFNQEFIQEGRANFHRSDIHKMPFEDDFFDKAFTINTFYFWEDHQAAISEIKRVLRPKGSFVLSIRPKHIMDKLSVTNYGFAKKSNAEVLDLLRSAGFGEIEVTEVKEPDQIRFGQNSKRESVMFHCRIG